MEKQYLKEACLELVTVNARPFNLMEDSGFHKIVNPIIAGLGGGFAINAENIREDVAQKGAKVCSQISKEVWGKMVCVIVDCATRLDRSIFSINVQFIRYINGSNTCFSLLFTSYILLYFCNIDGII